MFVAWFQFYVFFFCIFFMTKRIVLNQRYKKDILKSSPQNQPTNNLAFIILVSACYK